MALRILGEADDEIRQAAQWYQNQQTGVGDRFLDAVEAALEAIEREPDAYPVVDWIETNRQFRHFQLSVFPYLVVYEILGDDAVVLAVAHTNRGPFYWQRRVGS